MKNAHIEISNHVMVTLEHYRAFNKRYPNFMTLEQYMMEIGKLALEQGLMETKTEIVSESFDKGLFKERVGLHVSPPYTETH